MVPIAYMYACLLQVCECLCVCVNVCVWLEWLYVCPWACMRVDNLEIV